MNQNLIANLVKRPSNFLTSNWILDCGSYKAWFALCHSCSERTASKCGASSILSYFSGLVDKSIFSSWQSSNKWPDTRNNSFANHGWNRCPCPIQPKAMEIFMWFKHMFLDNSQPRTEPSSFSQCGYALTYLSRWSHLVWNTFEYNSNHYCSNHCYKSN